MNRKLGCVNPSKTKKHSTTDESTKKEREKTLPTLAHKVNTLEITKLLAGKNYRICGLWVQERESPN